MNKDNQEFNYNPFNQVLPAEYPKGQYVAYRDLIKRPKTILLKGVSIGTTSTSISHTLSVIPNFIQVKITSTGSLATWQEASAADATHIYLKASVATVADILVQYWPQNYK